MICVNMCHYLRLCDNNCAVPLNDVGAGASEDCAGCRKRKEHEEDFIENECKFSKQSPDEDSVSFLMRKWSSNSSGEESRSNDGLSPILDKVGVIKTFLEYKWFTSVYYPLKSTDIDITP